MSTPIPEGRYHELSSGLKIHVYEEGNVTPNKPSILCLHGGGPGASGYSNFKKNLPALAACGYHALAPDLAGFGLSDKPEDIAYTSRMHIECMLELCDLMGIATFIPIGNSLGGSVALELYFEAPQRVAALVLMAPGGLADPATFWGTTEGGSALAEFSRERPTDVDSFRAVLSLLVHDPALIDDAMIAERHPVALQQPSCVFTSVGIQPTWESLSSIDCPILCFWGANDRFLPVSQSLDLLAAAPQVKVVISNQAGHWYMLELAADFNREVIDFLSITVIDAASVNSDK